jgi:hypothetical protein
MSHHTIPEPDCSDKALTRRSDIYVARRRSRDGIIDAEPLPQDVDVHEYQPAGYAAHETQTYPPPPIPVRIRRQPQGSVAPAPPSQSPLQGHSTGFMRQFTDYLLEEIEDPDTAVASSDEAVSKVPRIIKLSFVQDQLGTHLYFFISRGARPLLLSLFAIIILLAMGKLSDALELLARFVF